MFFRRSIICEMKNYAYSTFSNFKFQCFNEQNVLGNGVYVSSISDREFLLHLDEYFESLREKNQQCLKVGGFNKDFPQKCKILVY